MKAHIGTTIGAELEYVGDTTPLMVELANQGWCAEGSQHGYHCTCELCNHQTGLLYRCQRDSTVSGEFITRILSDWPTAKLAFDVLANAAKKVNRKPKGYRYSWDPPVQVSRRCGLHIHVRGSAYSWSTSWTQLVAAYLWYERWMQLIGSGPFADKREGMNITFLQALRERGRNTGDIVETSVAADLCARQVQNDRHIDLNYSRNYDTFEFRVYNSTLDAWQMELAARLSVAFTMAACGSLPYPPRLRVPATPIPTLTPPVSMASFVTILGRFDEELPPLIERQLALYPTRTTEIIDAWEAEPIPDAPTPPLRATPSSSGSLPSGIVADDNGALREVSGALLGCTCEECVATRRSYDEPVAAIAFPEPEAEAEAERPRNDPWNGVVESVGRASSGFGALVEPTFLSSTFANTVRNASDPVRIYYERAVPGPSDDEGQVF